MSSASVDVLVVGGGPGGLYAAGLLARGGHRVLVCEEHPTIGDPVHCTGIVAPTIFEEFDVPRDAILNPLTRVRFVSPSGLSIEYAPASAEATVVDRGRFDRGLAAWARLAGAEIRTNTRVRDLQVTHDAVTAVAAQELVRSRMVILACGASYRMQRYAGCGLPSRYLHTAQRELPAATLHDVEMHFGSAIAPGGFAWAVPVLRPEGKFVRVGAMATRDAAGSFRLMLERIADRWGVSSRDTDARLKILPLGSIGRTYGTRMLAVGDAAGLVKPTTGGGIYYSVMSADLAARTAARALEADRLDARSLSTYEAGWRRRLGSEFEAQDSLRSVATAMSDGQIDALFDLAQHDGVMPLVRKTAKFNEHRHLIRALFKHPPARRILFRSVFG